MSVIKRECTFTGRAFCSVDESNPEFVKGMRAAYIPIVCKAGDVQEAIGMMVSELSENALSLRGFDYIFDINFLDRPTSEVEDKLIEKLSSYPVQFENVHFFKPDS